MSDLESVSPATGEVIVALDVDDLERARRIVADLDGVCGHYKLGLQLLTAHGPGIARELVAAGHDVFLDLKLFEIPASVASAVRAAGALGASMVTVHAMAGPTILAAAVEAASEYPRLRVLALTVVTSMTDADLTAVGINSTAPEQALRLGRLARAAGCHGVIASPSDAGPLRAALGPDAVIVTPGVTLGPGPVTEHARPTTPAQAFHAGASHVVLGRSITGAADPRAVYTAVRDSMRA